MRVLGIDPGSTATGFGLVLRERGSVVHLAHGCLRPPRDAAISDRLSFLYTRISELVELHRPESAVVEQVFIARNPRSALVLGQARGVALAALGGSGIPVDEISAREVKQAVVGNGNASKAQVQEMVARLLGLADKPQSDAADALAAAICFVSAGPLSSLGVPKRRRSLRSLAKQLS